MYHADATVHPALRPCVSGLTGYRYAGLPPGVHIGMPSTGLTMVFSLDGPLEVSWPSADGHAAPRRYDVSLAGLHDRPAHVHHQGFQEGIQVDLTPVGARRLLGCPASELASGTWELADVLGPLAGRLREQLALEPDWDRRYALVQGALLRRLGGGTGPAFWGPGPELGRAWRLVLGSGGRLTIGRIAADVGWSVRHLGERFRAEYGLTPKATARVARFGRSRELLRRRGARHICGYADQAHLTREWRDIAGTTPTRWWAQDDLAFVQDADADHA